jgi:drug/metabolite transporter (DMT)-like permease
MVSALPYIGDVKDSRHRLWAAEAGVTHEEKRTWIRLVTAVLGYAAYLAIVLGRADGRPLTDVPYAAPLLWTIGAAIVASIVADIGIGVVSPREPRDKDVRDREIGRLGNHVGQSFVVIGATAAMVMAMAGWHQFWIANVVYLCFVLSAILGGITRIVAYRRSLPQW